MLLSKTFKPSPGGQDELLDGDNPLGTLSAKINIAYRLGLIDSRFAKSLHLLRRIRNSFAHEFKSMSLTNGGHADRIREMLVHFKDYVGYHDYKEEYFKDSDGLDVAFKIIVTIAIIRLDTAIHYTEQISNDGTNLIPPVWKAKLKANDQKLNMSNKNSRKTPTKNAANKVLPKTAQK